MTESLACSLCGNVRSATPLDMDDPVFGTYVKLVRRLGFSKRKEAPGICGECMPRYGRMARDYQKKWVLYSAGGLVFGLAYLSITRNLVISAVIACLTGSLSIFSYCPPLKKG